MPGLNGPAPSRRRVLVFLVTFLPAAIASLIFVYTRPPEYRAAARLQITPAAGVALAPGAKDTGPIVTDTRSFLTEVQILTSRPLVADAIERLRSSGEVPDLGPDPVGAAQKMLYAEPVGGTQIVKLSATGSRRQFVGHLVNVVAEAYRQQITLSYKDLTTNTTAEVTGEANALAAKIAAQRQAVNAFRQRYDIVSIEHQENDVLANIQGLSKTYTEANQRLAKAQGRLDALKAGKAITRAKDDPTLASLQQRASLLREQWRDMQGRFTASYLALDPDAKALRARLDDLEDQLKSQVDIGERAEHADAQQELAAARTAVAELQKDVADNQKRAQEFATYLNDYKAMSEDLDHLEEMRRAALDRLAKMQASEQERAPRIDVLEAATLPTQPWRPDYTLDATLGVGGSFALALLAIWFVDFLAGPSHQSPAFAAYAWPSALLPAERATPPLLVTPDIARLPPPEPAPRELADAEIAALLAAAGGDARLVAAMLLSGLGIEEIIALDWTAVDFSAALIHIGGASARELPLGEPMRSLLRAQRERWPAAAGAVLQRRDGNRFSFEEIARLILFAAYDSGLERPQEVTPAALRYTYIGYLLRQGVRAGDIERIVGHVPQADLVACMQNNSPPSRQPFDEVDQLFPALRAFASGNAASSEKGLRDGL